MRTSGSFKRGVALALFFLPVVALSAPSSTSQSGFIHMPDGRVAEDGTLTLGGSHMSPYSALWGNITLFPGVEFSGRFTRTADVAGFDTPGFGENFGAQKDKAFDLKVRLLRETAFLPAVAFGLHDLHGTGLFNGRYLAASKRFDTARFGAFDLGVGVGSGRFGGGFGGVRWYLPGSNFRLLAEWDGYDYENDFWSLNTDGSEPLRRDGGLTLGVEYQHGWFLLQGAHQDGEIGATLSVSLPLQQRTFLPKTDEPAPVPVTLERRPN
ncbi:MAG: YjbH domain-containing protein [Gammaproteobacteria bacterium]